MKDEIERLVRHSAIFLIGLIFQRLARFLLLPLYWAVFPPAQFGLLDLFEVFIQVMVLAFSLALPTAYVKFSRIDVEEGVEPEALRGATTALALGGMALLVLIMAVFQGPLSWLFFGGRHPSLYAVSGGAAVASIAFVFVQAALRARGRAVMYVLLSSLQFLLLIVLNIYFVAWRGMGIEGVLWGTVLGCGVPALAYLAATAPAVRLRFDKAVAARLLRFALPLVPFSLVAFLLTISARLFLQHFQGTAAVGIFSAASRVALILLLICVTPFQTAWGYLGLDYLRRADAPEILSRTFTYLLVVGLWVFLIISALGREMLVLFGKAAYLPALPYVDPLMAAYLMQLFFYWANIVLVGRDMTMRILLISLLPFAISVGGGWLAIPRYGLPAACAVVLAAMATHAILTAVVARRIVTFRIERARVLKIVATFVIVYGAGHMLMRAAPQGRLAISALAVAAYPALLWLMRFLTAGEISRLRELRQSAGMPPR